MFFLLTISFTLHANTAAYLHKYIAWDLSKFSPTAFFSPAPPLNVLQFCFAAQRGKIEKNSSNSLSHLSRSNNSTSRHMGFGFQFFCSVDLQGALLCWLGAGGSSYPRCAALHHHCFTEQPSFAGALLPALHQVECRSLACIL